MLPNDITIQELVKNTWLCIPTAEGGGSINAWKDTGVNMLAMSPKPIEGADVFVQCDHEKYRGHPWGIHTLFSKAFNELGALICIIGQDDNWPTVSIERYVTDYFDRFPNLDGIMEPSLGKPTTQRDLVISGFIGKNFFEKYNNGNGVYDLSYNHFYADQELSRASEAMGKLYRNEGVEFRHIHWTQRKINRPWYMERWKALAPKDYENFNKRMASGFDMVKSVYEELISGKRVALVGPASYLDGSGFGKIIDSYDVVGRCGLVFPITNPEDFGSRTDIIYENFWGWKTGDHKPDVTMRLWKRAGFKHIRMVYGENKGFAMFRDMGEPNHSRINEVVRNKYSGLINKPTKGILAICDLHESDASEIYVTGFSFSQKYGYSSAYSKSPAYDNPQKDMTEQDSLVLYNKQKDHNPFNELKFFDELKRKDSRIKVDNILRGIIDDIGNGNRHLKSNESGGEK